MVRWLGGWMVEWLDGSWWMDGWVFGITNNNQIIYTSPSRLNASFSQNTYIIHSPLEKYITSCNLDEANKSNV